VTTEERYVAAAYLVVFAVVLVYLVIISAKVARLERTLGELVEAAKPPVRLGGPVEGARGNREVPPAG
jgi:hypothetical protein